MINTAGRPAALSFVPMSTSPLPEWERLRLRRAEDEFASVRKSTRVAYTFWLFTGIFGGHRFYLGDTGRSIAMLFTLGGLGSWTLIDVFLVGRRVETVNAARRAAIMSRHGVIETPVTGAR